MLYRRLTIYSGMLLALAVFPVLTLIRILPRFPFTHLTLMTFALTWLTCMVCGASQQLSEVERPHFDPVTTASMLIASLSALWVATHY